LKATKLQSGRSESFESLSLSARVSLSDLSFLRSGNPAEHELSDCSWNEMSVDLSTKTDTREEAITRNNDNNSKYLNEDHILSVKSNNFDDDDDDDDDDKVFRCVFFLVLRLSQISKAL
jgi:hypothetical protein